MPKHSKIPAAEIARGLNFRGGIVVVPEMAPEEVTASDLAGGADVTRKKFAGAGDAGPGQTIVDAGGPRLATVHVNLIFWGSAWQSDPARLALTNGVAKIL